jgi:hypothetical protein
MSFWQTAKGILTGPFVTNSLILIAAIILIAQGAMTLGVTEKNRNASEKNKADVRPVTNFSLAIAVLFMLFAFYRLLCGYFPPLRYSVVCNPGKLLSMGKGLLTAASAAVTTAAATAAPALAAAAAAPK